MSMRSMREVPYFDKQSQWLYKYGEKPTLFNSAEKEQAVKDGWVDSPDKTATSKPKTAPKKVSKTTKVYADSKSLLNEE